jgi:hypothetical protein
MFLGVLVSAQVAFGLEPAGADRWARPAPLQAAPLPRLAQPLILDGDLKEWSGGACIPIHSQYSIAHIRPDHKWKGPADCGLEAYAAWNDDGLCLAAAVADDEVINTKPNTALYEQDCVELYVDGRAPQWLMASPYTRGAYQLQVRPPTATRDAEIVVNPRDGKIEDLRMAAKRTATGYTIEVLVPWKALPGVSAKPGVQVGLQFEVDDYDARDGNIAWGIVPTDPDALGPLSAKALRKRLLEFVARIEPLGFKREQVLAQSLITPSCGLGSRDIETATRALELTRDLAAGLRKDFLGIQ